MVKNSATKVVLAALFIFSFIVTPLAHAQTGSASRLGITVSPVVDEFSIKPGETVVRHVKVTNPVQQIVTLYPQVLNFTTDNENGQPAFYNLNEKNTRYALSDWVKFSKEFIRIAPNENEVVDVTITAPENAEPGGHYGAVLFSTEPPKVSEDVSQVSVVGLIGALMLAAVPGATTQNTTIDSFDAPSILVNGPALLSLVFNNAGNLHSKPQGEIKIRNWSGALVTALKINEGGGNVLPDSKRRFNAKWVFDWKRFGKYSATAVISYGNPEKQLAATRNFFVVPVWLMVLAALIILLVIYLVVIRRAVRQRNRFSPPKQRPPQPQAPPAPQPAPKPPRIVMR